MTIRTPTSGPAVVLLSGGLDSTTAAYLARASGFAVHALSFDYGQRHRRELEAAAKIARRLGASEHRVIRVGLSDWAGSSLTGTGSIPDQPDDSRIPSTWVPARNHIFLAIAHGFAEVIGAKAIYIGISQVDYSGYPDCRREFLDAYQRAADLASKQFDEEGVSIPVIAPLLHRSKAETIRIGLSLGIDYGITWSCYAGGSIPCGVCDSCRLRAAAFNSAGVADPLITG